MLSVIVLNVMVPINGAIIVLHSKERLIALLTSIRLGWLTVTNTLADYAIEFITAVNIFDVFSMVEWHLPVATFAQMTFVQSKLGEGEGTMLGGGKALS
jgi:hypothetical protein